MGGGAKENTPTALWTLNCVQLCSPRENRQPRGACREAAGKGPALVPSFEDSRAAGPGFSEIEPRPTGLWSTCLTAGFTVHAGILPSSQAALEKTQKLSLPGPHGETLCVNRGKDPKR